MSEKAPSITDIEQRIDDLEARLAFQDDIINTLSEQLSHHQETINRLWEANRLLHDEIRAQTPGRFQELAASDHEPPPHY